MSHSTPAQEEEAIRVARDFFESRRRIRYEYAEERRARRRRRALIALLVLVAFTFVAFYAAGMMPL